MQRRFLEGIRFFLKFQIFSALYRHLTEIAEVHYSTEQKSIEKLTATVLKCFDIFKNSVHSLELVRRQVIRRLSRHQTIYNVLKYRKTWWENDDISIYRYRTGTGNKLNLIMHMTVR